MHDEQNRTKTEWWAMAAAITLCIVGTSTTSHGDSLPPLATFAASATVTGNLGFPTLNDFTLEPGGLAREDLPILGSAHAEAAALTGGTVVDIRAQAQGTGVTPVRWTVNCFRDGHWTAPEGDSEVAPPWSIVAPEGTGRSPIPAVRSYIRGDR
jgi:hypothetical protein